MFEEDCDCGVCSFCNGMSQDHELSADDSGAMLIQVLDPRDEVLKGLAAILPPMNVEEIVLLNNLREESGLIKIAAKHKPNNPKLWSKCIAEAKRKFDVFPSAYANGFASRLYKKEGGTWKTVKPKNGGK